MKNFLTSKQVLIFILGLAKLHTGRLGLQEKFATSKVVFNREVLDVISQTRFEMEEELDKRHGALSRCLKKLNDRDRRMVLTRYETGKNVSAAAQASLEELYKVLTSP